MTNLVARIDHTLLKPEAMQTDIRKLCEEAIRLPFATVCVHSFWAPYVENILRGTERTICCVVGFPTGIHPADVKAQEAIWAVQNGAREIDMVWNIGAVKSGDWKSVEIDVRSVVHAVAPLPVKVILETALMTPVEIRQGCEICGEAGAAFVKTSTGFHACGGATIEAVRLMRECAGDAMGVKASGGIRDIPTALAMIAAGANRIGTSSGVAIASFLSESH
ncbi:MAG: deoxyribose-phosphate aldolase [bacterium]|nr:deoxyribose-phosphate aldolase [bacterium]